ncbi:urea transporter [Streptomyces sp. VRA16 Mangrove soil]|uniref:urea transporter n=1 Tax=Streptomyces sp. VRA16 Mangrove soil TaxID=2817434 RepID=UPI001E4921E0|nr:urea transporter [Streptomyces sp. VRA16 Mangrove soil]
MRLLRGTGQVTFLPRASTGLLFTVALFAAGWQYGLYGLGGTAVGTAGAWLLGVDEERLAQGMEGFNSCLVGVSGAVLLGPDRLSTVLVALLGCGAATVLTAAAGRAFGAWGLPALTLPFCTVATAITLARPAGPVTAPAADGAGPVRLADAARGFLVGFGQVFLLPHWYVGAFVLAGLLAAGARVAAVACLGNAAGLATAWALGMSADRIADGLGGYNGVLVALALCGVFLDARWRTLPYALAGAVVATAAAPAFGATAFTWPFVLTTLVFLAAARSFPRLTAAP